MTNDERQTNCCCLMFRNHHAKYPLIQALFNDYFTVIGLAFPFDICHLSFDFSLQTFDFRLFSFNFYRTFAFFKIQKSWFINSGRF